MKYKNTAVSQQKRKQRARHFGAPSHVKRNLMSSSLSKELRQKFNVRAVPVRKGDEVKVMVGKYRGKEGKVKRVFRMKFRIFINGVTVEKANGTAVEVPIHPSNVQIKKLFLNKDRKQLLSEKAKLKNKEKGKVTDADVADAKQ